MINTHTRVSVAVHKGEKSASPFLRGAETVLFPARDPARPASR
jgi:hypothetical protein